jgi:vacuolar-type H+-ATPase subunit H
MEGIELLQDLARLERELKEKLEEARRSAKSRIARAEEEAGRILADAEAQIRRMTGVEKSQLKEECGNILQESRHRAEAEARSIREQAEPRMAKTVEFIISKVLP